MLFLVALVSQIWQRRILTILLTLWRSLTFSSIFPISTASWTFSASPLPSLLQVLKDQLVTFLLMQIATSYSFPLNLAGTPFSSHNFFFAVIYAVRSFMPIIKFTGCSNYSYRGVSEGCSNAGTETHHSYYLTERPLSQIILPLWQGETGSDILVVSSTSLPV